MTTVGLYGGSFNPPHVAHQLVALYVLETQPIDELWFVPTYHHPFGKALVASRTLDLVDYVAGLGVQPRLVIGSDILGETAKWYRWDEVRDKAPPIVVGRSGYPGSTGLAMPEISATAIRAMLAEPERSAALEALLPKSVLRYIADRGLYQ
jgi:nicotinate-nucleotide adenylyltransferase